MLSNLGKSIQKILTSYLLFFIILVNAVCVVYYFAQKQDFHVDEMFSFGPANSRTGPFLFEGVDAYFNDYKHSAYDNIHTGKDFHDYIAVSNEHTFDYENVLNNVQKDVHPPLYFLVLHTICSFFPDVFSKWLGLPINLLALIITLLFVYKISQKVFKDSKISYLSVIFFGFSLVTLSIAVYIRSYMLQMCLSSWLFWENLKLLEKNKFDGKIFVSIFVAALLGYLTHYYLLVNTFFLSAVTCFILLKNKNFKLLWQYVLLMFASVISFFVVYPLAIYALLHSQRASQMLGHELYYYLINLNNLLGRPFDLVLYHILPFDSVPIIYFVGVLVFLYVFVKMRGSYKPSNNSVNLLLYTMPCALCLAIIFPEMYQFNFRYFSPLVPMLCILIIYGVIRVLEVLKVRQKVIFYILSVLVFFNICLTNFNYRSVYAMKGSQKLTDFQNLISGKKLLYVGYIPDCIAFSWIFLNAKSVYLLHPDDIGDYILEAKEDWLILFNPYSHLYKQKDMQPLPTADNITEHTDFYFTFVKEPDQYDFYKIKGEK